MSGYGWIGAVVIFGLWAICFVWTAITAPGFHVRGQHVLVTGATKGLGLAVAKRYARAGAKLTLVGRSMTRLHAARAAIEADTKESVEIYVYEADLTVPEQVDAMISEANAFHGRPTDHIVCTAATGKRGFFVDADVDAMRTIMDLNYHAPVNVVKSALPPMIQHNVRGRVVLVSSTEAFHSAADSSLVSGAAFALKGLAEALRNELQLYDMSVHIFYPGSYLPPFPSSAKATADAPSTPVHEELTADYATFSSSSSPQPTDCDALADALIAGITRGHVSITSSSSGLVLRSLANGIVPRVNSMFELVVTPIYIIVFGVITAFHEQPSQAQKQAAAARAARVLELESTLE